MKKDMEVLLIIIAFSFIISIVSLTLLGLENLITPFLGLSLSDSINPCTFVIYTMLLIALSVKEVSKRQVYAVGLAFVAAIYISYYMLGVGLVVFSTNIPTWIAGILAIIFGIYGAFENSREEGDKEEDFQQGYDDNRSIHPWNNSILHPFAVLGRKLFNLCHTDFQSWGSRLCPPGTL